MSAQLLTTPAEGALTDEQLEAIARRRGPLLIAAGAGSGKTSVLVERFVEAVRSDVTGPTRILAITFTERAAAELRQRVRERLLELGERRAAGELEGAFLSTFHGFCASILRAEALSAGLDPDFQILEEGLAGQLRGDAFARALEGFIAHRGEDALELLASYGAQRTRSAILDAYAELRSRGERRPELSKPRPGARLDDALAALERALPAALEEVRGAFERRPGVRLEGALERLELAQMLLGERPGSSGHRSQRELSRLKLPGAGSGALAGHACRGYRAALAEYARACADRDGARVCVELSELMANFATAYEELKRARGALDFDDLELHARDLLRNDERVRAGWSERFELLMVDEFQDSNPRQLEILAALERENLCTVGDEFQSIYGFRHADVSLFRARRERLGERCAVLTLARNFRGRGELLEVTNAVFSARFGADYEPLLAGRAESAATDEAPLTELLLTDKRGWTEDEERGQHGARPWREEEARALARRIADLIDAGHARAADVALLLRSLGDAETYQRALARHRIQTIAEVGGFWGHQQVEDLIAFMRALANPLDEVALYSTLASPLVGVSSDGLALLARAARQSRVSLWETIKDAGAELLPRLSSGDAQALESFTARFAKDRSSPRLPLARIIERAVRHNGYDEHLLSLPDGARRLANVHKLERVAGRFESSEGRDLRAFLDHVEHLRAERDTSEPDAPVAEETLDAVRLMSIHAAKGLEFGVVCVADMGRSARNGVPDLLLGTGEEGRLGLRLVPLDGSPAIGALDFDELRAERERSEAQEEDRIVYVAMTRARERLLLSGAVDFANWPEDKPGAAPISWLAPALIEDLPARLNGDQTVFDEPVPGGLAHVRCWLNTPSSIPEPRCAPAGVPAAPPLVGDPLAERQRGACRAQPAAAEPPAGSIFARERTLSYSSLRLLERCGYSYYLRRVLGLPDESAGAPSSEPAKPGAAGRSRGLIVHRLLETLDFTRFERPTLEDVTRAARELGLELAAADRERIGELVGELAGSELAQRLEDAVSLAREQPFAFSLEGHAPIFTGVLDTVARERDGGWLVVDYKSDRLASPGEDLEALAQRKYGLQRLLYGIAALRAGAPRVSVVHWFLERPHEWVGACYAEAQTEALQTELAARLERMGAAGFAVSEEPHRELCLTCPGRRGLCSWPEERTLAEAPAADRAGAERPRSMAGA